MYQVSSYSGFELDVIAYGTFRIPPGEETYRCVSEAIECGYGSIDTACYYNNEADVGRAVKARNVKVHITTKVWNDMQGYENAIDSAKRSRDLLAVESIDLLLVHWPTQDSKKMLETWQAFERLKEDGIVKRIGVSNFNQEHLQMLEDSGFSRPEVNQIEVNPLFTQEALRVFCQDKGIIVEAWRPLVDNQLVRLAPVQKIADKYNKTLAQLALRWAVSSGMRVLAKSTQVKRMKENIDIFDFDLNSEEINEIDNLNENLRLGPDPVAFW